MTALVCVLAALVVVLAGLNAFVMWCNSQLRHEVRRGRRTAMTAPPSRVTYAAGGVIPEQRRGGNQ